MHVLVYSHNALECMSDTASEEVVNITIFSRDNEPSNLVGIPLSNHSFYNPA